MIHNFRTRKDKSFASVTRYMYYNGFLDNLSTRNMGLANDILVIRSSLKKLVSVRKGKLKSYEKQSLRMKTI